MSDAKVEIPRVSVITCSYNHANFVRKTIESVISQTFTNWEYIIVDDQSTDNSLEIIKSYSDPRIRSFVSPQKGAVESYNFAFSMCKGDFFISLDSDDAMFPERLEKQVRFLDNRPEIGVLGTWVKEIDANGGESANESEGEKWFNTNLDLNLLTSWIWKNHLNHSSVMIRRHIHEKIGMYDSRLSRTGDFEFFTRCLMSGIKFSVLPEILTYYRVHGLNVTHLNPVQSFIELSYIHRKYLLPFLLKSGDKQAVNDMWIGFFNHSAYINASEPEIKSQYLKLFLSNGFVLPYAHAQVIGFSTSCEEVEMLVPTLTIYLDKLLNSIKWSSSQIASLERELGRVYLSEKRLEQDVRNLEQYAGFPGSRKRRALNFVNRLQFRIKSLMKGEL
jgi:glycosyltransferase involved in cell wall biosynthesis